MPHNSDECEKPVINGTEAENNEADKHPLYPEGIPDEDRAMTNKAGRKDTATFKSIIIASIILTLVIIVVSALIALIRNDMIDFPMFGGDEEVTDAVTDAAKETATPVPVEIISDPVTEGDFTYVYVEKCYESPRLSDSVRITAYIGEDSALTIPETLGGHEVRSIGDGAFKGNSRIVSLTVPDCVMMIGADCFNSCIALESVTLGSVTVMGARAFAACHLLTSVTLDEGCTMIGTRAFSLCTALKSVNLPDSMKTVCEFAFASDRALESVTFGTGLESLQNNVFVGCSSLTAFTYRGTKSQWDALDISDDYIEMKTAKMEYEG